MTPYISSQTNTIEYRYRQKFSSGDITILGALSKDDISDKAIRGYYKARGNFKLAYGINLKIEASQTNDDKYLGDYSYGSLEDLDTAITLGKAAVNKDRLFSGNISYVKANKDDNSLEEFYSLSGQYKKSIKQTLLPGNLFFESEANSSLNVAQGGQVSRPPSSISSQIRFSNVRYAGSVQILDQSFARLTSFVNSENIGSLQEEFMLQYGASTTLSVPLYQKRDTQIRQVIPKIMLSYNGQESKTKGDYFVGDNQLSLGNLYAGKKMMSSSESELGFSVSGGTDYRFDWSDGRALDFWFGGCGFKTPQRFRMKKLIFKPENLIMWEGLTTKQIILFLLMGIR